MNQIEILRKIGRRLFVISFIFFRHFLSSQKIIITILIESCEVIDIVIILLILKVLTVDKGSKINYVLLTASQFSRNF